MTEAPLDAVVVGAGLAGLSCARALQAAGRRVLVLEASDGVGGRVRTDAVDGFLLDRGFQVLLTAYPEVPHQLDVPALRLHRFDPGAMVWLDGRGHVLGDPRRAPRTALATATSPVGTLGDKARIAWLRRRVATTPAAQLLRQPDLDTITALRARGFSAGFIQRFLRPLFAGIQLDPALSTSVRMFDVIFRSLATGDAALPAAGMQAIPDQLAARLAPGTVVVDTPVVAVAPGAVSLAGGRTVTARAVVVATEGPAASTLLGLPPVGSKPVAAAYFAAPRPPVDDRLVLLDGTGAGPALNVAVLSNVAPTYAPPGQALVVAACPGAPPGDVAEACRRQLRGWFGAQVDGWRHLRSYAIPHGQPDQRPPFHPKQRVALGDGLFVCGDHRDTASIQGALFSGRRSGEAAAAWLA